jgi:hypothetical protein
MTSVFIVSYNIDGNYPITYFASISNDVLSQEIKFSDVLNEVLANTIKQIIHDEFHNLQNYELEGQCKKCLEYDCDDKLFNRINILYAGKIA